MAALTTGSFTLPPQKLDPWLGKVQSGSVVAALSNSIPMKFGPGQSMTFDIGEAEYVAEGANKGASTITPTTVTATPFKFHKTVRWTEEVKWADEDDVIDVVEQVGGLLLQVELALVADGVSLVEQVASDGGSLRVPQGLQGVPCLRGEDGLL